MLDYNSGKKEILSFLSCSTEGEFWELRSSLLQLVPLILVVDDNTVTVGNVTKRVAFKQQMTQTRVEYGIYVSCVNFKCLYMRTADVICLL